MPAHISRKGLFVVGRFRSGSTAVWNVLRHIPGVTTYYEPCHDSLLEHIRTHTLADPSHIGVSEYWKEYVPIMERLPAYYRRDFATRRLCLSADADHPELEQYLRFLVASAPEGNIAALKLNRMDLRLPWLRRRFPETPILYIYRNPRDNWVSMVRNQPAGRVDDPWLNSGYDLVVWSANLAPYVPLLGSDRITTSYERHYLIWRICRELGQLHADCVLSFDEDIQGHPKTGLGKLRELIGIDESLTDDLRSLLVEVKGGAWRDYHDDAWFSDIEMRCDSYLHEAGIRERIRNKQLFSAFSRGIQGDWPAMLNGLVYPLCSEISRCRSVSLENLTGRNAALAHAHAHIQELENELRKITTDSMKALGERDRELDKIRRDGNEEIARRDEIISEQRRFNQSLEERLEKVSNDSRDEIARREAMISGQNGYIVSLEKEVAKLNRDAGEQIAARDAALVETRRYAQSLEDEVKKVVTDAELEIRARDEIIASKEGYISSLGKKLRDWKGGHGE
jgi:hypothetical protein